MATDLERLVVSLDADIKKFDSSLKRAVATFNGETKKIETRAKVMQKNVSRHLPISAKDLHLVLSLPVPLLRLRTLQTARPGRKTL